MHESFQVYKFLERKVCERYSGDIILTKNYNFWENQNKIHIFAIFLLKWATKNKIPKVSFELFYYPFDFILNKVKKVKVCQKTEVKLLPY